MHVLKRYGWVVIAALLVGSLAWALARGDGPSTEILLPDGSRAEVTPVDEMRVRTAEPAPFIDEADYRLRVTGLVEEEITLSLAEVTALPAEERLVELPCVEGWTERALWKGTRLMPLLERAGIGEEADSVVFSSPGGYTTSLTLQDIRESDPLLAYAVNGETLPREQGFPLRLVVPGKLGYKWIKWLTGIEVTSGEYRGYWESRGYSNEADATGR